MHGSNMITVAEVGRGHHGTVQFCIQMCTHVLTLTCLARKKESRSEGQG